MQAKLRAKFGKPTQTGGKGSVRRKHKSVRKGNQDDKRLQSTLKKLGVQPIEQIEEVNLFRKDGSIIHFGRPRVQAAIQAHTFVVGGKAEDKQVTDLLPGILTQLGPDAMESLKKIVGAYQSEQQDDEDEDVPDLVENFEAEAEKE